MSVTSPSNVQATYCATLVDEWVRCGVVDAVICPGSRSTPLALALAQRSEIAIHVRIDERSAGFFALGRSLATQRATIILVTSGTAATELHPVVAEADLARVPLIVVTADRPPELHGVGAPQTVLQSQIFSSMVRRFEEPGVAREESRASWRPLASRLWRAALANSAGPVHLNAAFVEPLVGEVEELPDGRANGEAWRRDEHAARGDRREISVGSRPLVIGGVGANLDVLEQAQRFGWPVLGDATVLGSTAYFDSILRDDVVSKVLSPDFVIRCGALPASKVLAQRLREWRAPVWAVGETNEINDPESLIERSVGGPVRLVAVDANSASVYGELWRAASAVAGEVLSQFDDGASLLSEPSIARLLVRLSGETTTSLVVGSSMPIREIEWWGEPRSTPLFANRGVNGIDGVNSTVLGVAAGARAIGLVGDVTFLHDVSALTDGLGAVGGACALVVVDNGGGGIFSFLPQASSLDSDLFSELFSTPRHHDVVAIARSFSHRGVVVETNDELQSAVRDAVGREGLTVIVATVPHHRDNVILHDELNELIGQLVRERLT